VKLSPEKCSLASTSLVGVLLRPLGANRAAEAVRLALGGDFRLLKANLVEDLVRYGGAASRLYSK
jgi:hypothetical protein